jgi:hypothetical protein
MARDNPALGLHSDTGELLKLGHRIGASPSHTMFPELRRRARASRTTFGMARHRQVEVTVTDGAAIVEAKRRDSVIASQLDEAGLDIGVDAKSPVRCPAGMGSGPGNGCCDLHCGWGPRLLGNNSIHRATPPVPENTVESVKRDVATVQERSKR